MRGEPLDGRTDLFSLGVLAYGMLSRIRPFGGETIKVPFTVQTDPTEAP